MARNVLNITGQRFGRLVARAPTDKRDNKGSVFWECCCDCGNSCEVTADALVRKNTISCGCRKEEINSHIGEQLTFVDGTCVEWLRARKHRCDNTSGFRGVSSYRGKWRVTIGFQKKSYYCGTYASFEKAKAIRLEVESQLHDGFLLAWEKWNTRAKNEPGWGIKNPFVFEVTRQNGKFEINALAC